MAKLRSYKSISRPSLAGSSSGFSSFASSLAKKQQAAEDAIIDNQYSEGQISAETYLSHINNRLVRPGLTPLQVVNLQEKSRNVTDKVNDAKVDTLYSSGKISTSEVLEYEQGKLERIPETDTVAYQNQSRKVQELTDKAEREARTAYRVQESLRIAKMPDDSSATLREKARLYERLENQARIDGDNQTADTLATSKQNYLDAAKRADINDLITNTRQSVSETLPGGQGVPSAEAGGQLYNQLIGGGRAPSAPTAGVGGAGGATTRGTTPVSKAIYSGGSNAAIRNAFEALDNSQKTLDRLAASRADKQAMIATYDKAIAQADGDQRTSLTIARNNLVSSLSEIDNSVEREYQNIQDKVGRIQEMQSKAAFSTFKSTVSSEKRAIDLEEKKLENDLRAGKITKEKYLFEAANLTGARIALHTDEATGYRQFDDHDRADQIEQTVAELSGTRPAVIHRALIDGVNKIPDLKRKDEFIKKTIDSMGQGFELIRIDRDGTLNNISGKAMKKGDISLMDVSEEKMKGTFKNNYVKDGSVYAKIQYPTQIDPVTGQEISVKDPKRIAGQKGNQPFYIGADGSAKRVKILEVTRPGGGKEYIPQTEEFVKKSKNMFVPAEGGADLIYKPRQAEIKSPGIIKQISDIRYNFSNPFTDKNTIGNKVSTEVAKAVSNATNFIHSVLPGFNKSTPPNVVQPTKQGSNPVLQGIQSAFGNIGNKIIKPVAAAEAPLKSQPSNVAPTVTGVPEELVRTLTNELKAQGQYNPKNLAYMLATIQHETANSFKPVNEGYYNDEKYGYQPGFTGRSEARKRGYSGGEDYFGRGYIQLTHDYNYADMSKKIGVDLVKNPELANDPKIAAKIAVQFAKDRGVLDLASKGDFVGARRPVNPDNKGQMIAQTATKYLNMLSNNNLPVVKGVQAAGKPINKPQLSPTPIQQPKTTTSNGAVIRSQTSQTAKVASAYDTPSPTYTPARDVQPLPTSTPRPTGVPIQDTVKPLNPVSKPIIQMPKITIPQFTAPKITIPTYKPPAPVQQAVKAVQQAPANIVKTVQQAAQNVGNFLQNLNPFKKKK